MLEKECEQCAGNGRAKIAVKTGKVVKGIDGVTVLPTMFDGETLLSVGVPDGDHSSYGYYGGSVLLADAISKEGGCFARLQG